MKKRIIKMGEEFQENKRLEQDFYTDFKRLDDCYSKCSDTKRNIYNYYYNLLKENTDKVEKYGVRSYNCNFINLHAIVEKDNKKLYLLITPSHNYFNEMESE